MIKKLRFRTARLALALVGVAGVCWACNAPFIPIPPPGQTATFSSQVVTDGAGAQKTVWIAHGPPNKDAAFARFYVFNERLLTGVIAEAMADGSFDSPPMDGVLDDRVDIKFETPAGGLTPDVCFMLTTDASITKPSTVPSAPHCP